MCGQKLCFLVSLRDVLRFAVGDEGGKIFSHDLEFVTPVRPKFLKKSARWELVSTIPQIC